MNFKSFTPNQRGNSPRISKQEWDKYRQILDDLHKNSFTRVQMLDVLREHGFYPSITQLNAKMVVWGYSRYRNNESRSEGGPLESADHESNSSDHLHDINHEAESHLVTDLTTHSTNDIESLQSSITRSPPLNGDKHTKLADEFRHCIVNFLDEWLQDQQRDHPTLTHKMLIDLSPQTQELQALADFYWAKAWVREAHELNTVLLYTAFYTTELDSSDLSDCLTRFRLSMTQGETRLYLTTRLFDAALLFYDSLGFHGITHCWFSGSMPKRTVGSSSVNRHMILFLLDVSSTKRQHFESENAYQQILGQYMQGCDCQHAKMAVFAEEFLKAILEYLPGYPYDQWASFQKTPLELHGLLRLIPQDTVRPTVCDNSACLHRTMFPTALSSLLLLIRSMISRDQDIRRIRPGNQISAQDHNTRILTFLNTEGSVCQQVLLDTWIRIHDSDYLHHYQDFAASKMGYMPIWELRRCPESWPLVRHLLHRPVPSMETTSRVLKSISDWSTRDLMFSDAPSPWTLPSFDDLYSLGVSKPSQGKSSASHSSWSFHRITGFPKPSSLVTETPNDIAEEVKSSDELDYEPQTQDWQLLSPQYFLLGTSDTYSSWA